MEDKVGSSKEVIPSAKADVDSIDVMYYGAYCWCNIVWSLKIKLWGPFGGGTQDSCGIQGRMEGKCLKENMDHTRTTYKP